MWRPLLDKQLICPFEEEEKRTGYNYVPNPLISFKIINDAM